MNVGHRILLSSAMGALVVCGGPAWPQAIQAARVADPTLTEVLVTAQKRTERLNTVPISITAISATQLNQTASKNLEELQGVVPGVTIPAATAYGGSSIVIRGTSGSGTFLEDDPVAVYVDGIYQASNSRFGVADLTDVANVEIVRGPQGTLQGRNATAGAILVRTADPTPTFGGVASVEVAAPFEYRLNAAVSIPVTDTFRVRISADHFDQQGWATNLYNNSHLGGEDATNARVVAVWTPDTRFTARLALNYQALTNTQASQRWASTFVNPTGVAENLADPTPFVPLPPSLRQFYLGGNQVYNDVLSKNEQKSPNMALELHADLGAVELVSLTGISYASNTGSADSGGLGATGTNGVSVIDALTGERRRAYNVGHITGSQETEELRLQSKGDGPLTWLAGLYGSHAHDSLHFDIFDYDLANAPPGDADVGFRARQKDYSGAAFADATYKLTPELSVTGGVRYTHESKTFLNSFSVTIPEIALVVVGPIAFAPPEDHWDDVSYRGNVKYQFTPDTMAYLSYSKGFKSGGFNAFGVGPQPAYNPEKLYSVELGAKSYFLQRRAYLAGSAYYNTYDNLQVTAGVPTGGVNVYNAAAAEIKGFELEGQVKLTNAFALSGNVAYTDAHYTTFPNGQGVEGNLVNATGNTLPNTPLVQYYLQGDYQTPISGAWNLHADVNWRFRDKVYFFGTNQEPNLTGGDDGELGARVDLTYDPQRVTVSVFGRNLNNKRVVNGEQADFAYPVAFFNEPRVVGFQLTKKF